MLLGTGTIFCGFGNIICENTIAASIQIGNFNFNLACTVRHDSVIMNYNVINPSVNISRGVELGMYLVQMQILQNIVFVAIYDGAGTVITGI